MHQIIVLLAMGFVWMMVVGCAAFRPMPEVTFPEIEVQENPRKAFVGDFHPLRPYDEFYRLPPQNVRLIHTDVALRPLWEQRTLEAEAILTLAADWPHVQSFAIDASQFELDSIGANRRFTYEYPEDSQGWRRRIYIRLHTPLRRGDTVSLYLRYRKRFSPPSHPHPWEQSDRLGMYWVNPRRKFPGKPRSLWTQGEVAYNSEWMPTIEHPRQKGTFTFRLTFDTAMVSVANGVLTYSYDNGNGTRTDVWQMNRPMSPYLAFVAIGEWSVVTEKYRDIPLMWIGERGYEAGGHVWLKRTAQMMRIFEKMFDEPFPWPKYGQIVVRDFVAGGMENASITSLYEGMNHNYLHASNRNSEGLIAHELGHQWWGDLVTLSSWPHLFINESWAEYSEYLWNEQKGDSVMAAQVLASWTPRVLWAIARGFQPIVNYHIADPEDLFDAHRYPRGAHQLHGLRWYLGDSLFWRAARHLLDTYKWKNVSLHDFISTFEATTGYDLEWLIYQLFLDETVPELALRYVALDSTTGSPSLSIRVLSHGNYLPVPLLVQYSDQLVRDTVWIWSEDTPIIYRFPRSDVQWFVFNAGRPWLMSLEEDLPADMAVQRFWECGKLVDQYFLRASLLKQLRNDSAVLWEFARQIPQASPPAQSLAFSILLEATESFHQGWQFLLPVAESLYRQSTPEHPHPSAFRWLGRYCLDTRSNAPQCRVMDPDSLEWVIRYHPVMNFRRLALWLLNRQDSVRAFEVAISDSLIHPFAKLEIIRQGPLQPALKWWIHILTAPSTSYHVQLYAQFARFLQRKSPDAPVKGLNRLAYLYLTEVPTQPDQYRTVLRATKQLRQWLDPNQDNYDDIVRHIGR